MWRLSNLGLPNSDFGIKIPCSETRNPQYESIKMEFFCRIYVDKEEIYAGDLKEVPEKFRDEIREAFTDWAESLGNRGLNELVYSLFSWYETKSMYCQKCERWMEENENCSICGGKLKEKFIYERNKKLDLLLTSVGMISRIEVLR